MVFRFHPQSTAVPSTDEARAVGWLAVDEITEQMDPAYAVRVTDALLPDGAVTRAHDGTNLFPT